MSFRINHQQPLLTPVLPDDIHWHRYWRPGESMWYGKLKKSQVAFDSSEEIIRQVNQYFSSRGSQISISDDYVWDACLEEHDLYENFIKMVWLLHDFCNEGWRDPVGSHWNPRTGNVVIHPGGTRNKILKLFQHENRSIETFFFNTGGFRSDWLDKNFSKIRNHLEYFKSIGWHIATVPDHGTFIPHPVNINSMNSLIPNQKKVWHNKLSHKLNNPNFHIYFDGLAVPLLAHYSTPDINKAQVRVMGITAYTPEIDFAALTIAALAEVDITFKGHSGTFYSVTQLSKGLPK